ncbi:MAG TPA: ATP-dependent DNA helicase RecG [Kiloniellales bacterium]|nr:ATP-dependent DNA helicase RecG [Kiloniellales bacterium]
MRPEVLYPLFAEATTLTGIGPRFGKLLAKLTEHNGAGGRLVDLLWHLPSGVIDRRYRPSVAEAQVGRIVTLTLTVDHRNQPRSNRQPWRVRCRDATGFVELVFFHAQEAWLDKLLPVGAERVVSGRLEEFHGGKQITHPDYVLSPEEAKDLPLIEAVYPLTAGLTPRVVQKAVAAALKRAPELTEWQDPALVRQRGWPSWRQALGRAHTPESDASLSVETPERQRLAFDELLANQLALLLVRARQKRARGRSLRGDGRLRSRVLEALPYRLTAAQRRAIDEILADMASGDRMLRLLQGDVGSGKTVVALMAMLTAAEAGGQAALMAPTELLARQHLLTLEPLAAAAGLRVELLTGRDKGRARGEILERIATGTAPLVVGTHAVFQEEVQFRNLLLAVVDEQHRFGVHQRLALAGKGQAVDILVMTATPIPRTLTLTLYGDMDVSKLDEKPPGRQPVDTRIVSLERQEEVIAAVGRALDSGTKVYWVCPLVEGSDESDLAAAQERHAELAARFGPERVGLVHGRMKGREKDAVMHGFAQGDIGLLIATTVIEVGVDVPKATVMVIEHAERFGLAQLHQLRGRIGRGSGRSTCLLLYGQPLGETARARLEILRETEDGFRIAEEDLRLRGAGELLGTRQSGFPEFRIADLALQADLLQIARDDAKRVIEQDPELTGPRGTALRTLLYLFERDEAVRLLRAG